MYITVVLSYYPECYNRASSFIKNRKVPTLITETFALFARKSVANSDQ